jgi:hypothetical protein
MAKKTITGNYRLTSLNGHGDCDGDKDILGIYMMFPIFLPEIILA